MALDWKEWNQWRKEITAGKDDWIGAARGDYGEYLYRARERFARGEAATIREVKALYRRVAAQLRSEIEGITPGTLRRAHLTALAVALEKAAKTLNQEVLDAITKGIRMAVDEAVSGPEEVARELFSGVFDQTEVKWLFDDINQRAVLSLLSRTRHDGLTLSDRVWRVSQHARQALQKIAEDGVTRGLDSRKLARQVQRYLQPDVWTALKADTRQRLGVPKSVSMEAVRLAVTEMNNAFHEGTINAYRAIPNARGIYWRLSANHPLPDICDDYASHNGNGFWPKGEEPAKPHPWCRCIAVPAMEDPDEFKDRLKAWMQDPGSQPDLEMWYNNTARRFLKRPAKLWTGVDFTGTQGQEIVSRHGWSQVLAAKVEEMGQQMKERTARYDVEFGAMIDAQTAQPIGEILGGTKNQLDMAPLLAIMKPDGKYVAIHTHPRSSSFSDADVKFISVYPNVKSMVVYGKDGTKYVISAKQGGRMASAEEITQAWEEEKRRLFVKYRDLVMSGKMNEDQAWKEHSHEIWKNIADRLGLVYDRKERGGW